MPSRWSGRRARYWTPKAGDFKVQRGTATIAGNATTAVITAGTNYIAPSALSKAWITIRASNHFGCETSTQTLSLEVVSAYVSNPANLLTSITFTRGASDVLNGINIDWEIIEYIGATGSANEIVVRGQELLTYGTGSNTVSGSALSPTTDAKVAVFITGEGSGTGSSNFLDVLSTAAWNSGTHAADFTRNRNSATAGVVSYVAVEFTGSNWAVQRVSHTFAAAGVEETAAITDIGSLARAFVHSQMNASGGNNVNGSIQVWLSATNTISFKMDSGATSPTTCVGVAWVVSNSQTGVGTANCNRYTNTYANDGNTDVTITAVTDLVQSSIEEISQSNTQNTPSGGRDQASHKLTTATNCRIFHTGLAGTTTYRFAVFEWPTAQPVIPITAFLYGGDDDAWIPQITLPGDPLISF